MDEYLQAVGALPAFLARPLSRIAPGTAAQIHEIRLRAGCPVWFNRNGALCPAGELPGCPAEVGALRLRFLLKALDLLTDELKAS